MCGDRGGHDRDDPCLQPEPMPGPYFAGVRVGRDQHTRVVDDRLHAVSRGAVQPGTAAGRVQFGRDQRAKMAMCNGCS
jgi:hypothetical protein